MKKIFFLANIFALSATLFLRTQVTIGALESPIFGEKQSEMLIQHSGQ